MVYDRGDDKLDRSTVKNLIGRSQSIKIVPRGEGTSTDVRRAISFKQSGTSAPSVSLQKAAEFKQTSVEETPPHSPEPVTEMVLARRPSESSSNEEGEEAPQLPHLPPPLPVAPAAVAEKPTDLVSQLPMSPSYTIKGGLSPPVSPTQKRPEQVSKVMFSLEFKGK